MAIELDVAGDFAQIVDGAEAITLRRRGSAATVAIDVAWRRLLATSEAEVSAGQASQADAEWQFAWDQNEDLPQLGDVLEDADGNFWTILAVAQLTARTRLRCQARDLRVAYGLDSWVDIQQAVWDDLGAGPEIVAWQTTRPRVAARIQPAQMTVDHQADPASSTATFRIILAEQIELDHDSRLVGPDGSVYQAGELTQAHRIDALPVVTAVKDDASG